METDGEKVMAIYGHRKMGTEVAGPNNHTSSNGNTTRTPGPHRQGMTRGEATGGSQRKRNWAGVEEPRMARLSHGLHFSYLPKK